MRHLCDDNEYEPTTDTSFNVERKLGGLNLQNFISFELTGDDQSTSSCYINEKGVDCYEMRRNLRPASAAAPSGVDCYLDPIYADYNGHCSCERASEGQQNICFWVSYFYDYDKSEQGF